MLLSIITINYNDADGLKKTIESVASQTFRSQIEHIIIDDGSTDGSLDVIKDYETDINYWNHRPNRGIYPTMNEGTQNAKGDYCLFLNSGDYLCHNKVIENIFVLLHDVDMVIGETIFTNSGLPSVVPPNITMKFLYEHSVPHPSTFIKRELLIKHPYDTSYCIVSDWKFFVQTLIYDNATYRLTNERITNYDCNGISSTRRDLCKMERSKVLEELFPPRVMQDYLQFVKGSGYQDKPYDKFFIKMRDYKYGHVLYTLDILIMRFIAIFKKGAKFSKQFPIRCED